jgi:hypothetical protein
MNKKGRIILCAAALLFFLLFYKVWKTPAMVNS